MNPWLIVTHKELRDLLRDRRTLINILVLGALLGPLLAMGMLTLAVKMISDESEKVIELPVQGAKHAPQLIRYLTDSGIKILPSPDDAAQLIRQQKADAVLVIDARFAQNLRAGHTATLVLMADHSRSRTTITRQRISNTLNLYANSIGRLRLSLRGVDPDISQVLIVQDQDLSPGDNDARLLEFLPYLLIIGIMQAAMVVAADLTAGERERLSLEPLMTNPVAPEQFMLGKLAANLLICLAVLALSLGGFFFGSRIVDLGDLGIRFPATAIPLLLLFLTPMAFMFAALMSFVGAFAHTVKEAQTYLSLLVLAALVPTMIQMLLQTQVHSWELLLPIWSHNYLINEILRGASLSLSQWLLPSLGALGAGSLFANLAGRLYRKPEFIF